MVEVAGTDMLAVTADIDIFFLHLNFYLFSIINIFAVQSVAAATAFLTPCLFFTCFWSF